MSDEKRFLALTASAAAMGTVLSSIVSCQITVATKVLKLMPEKEFDEAREEVMSELRNSIEQMSDVYKSLGRLKELLEEEENGSD
ncbi:hypothetical protein [Pseudomonas rhizoryzae]|uniref:hypothetical protein n=1 Tax=Pseudomonas rhizoryzae TaxID=2571129 RepID=UPI0010C1F046|nr:hypothetical protein [Pseudomonas rhizoryzae]